MKTVGVSEAAPAPSDYTEFWRQYRPLAVQILLRHRIEPGLCEDLASEVCARFFERDFLKVYDPDKVIVRDGVFLPTSFPAFFSGFVARYALGYRERNWVRRTREVELFEGEDGGLPARPDPSSLLSMFRVEDQLYWAEAREWLAGVPRRSKQDVCDLVALFDFIVVTVWEHGRLVQADIAGHFGVSTTAAGNWMKWLRTCLTEWRQAQW